MDFLATLTPLTPLRAALFALLHSLVRSAPLRSLVRFAPLRSLCSAPSATLPSLSPRTPLCSAQLVRSAPLRSLVRFAPLRLLRSLCPFRFAPLGPLGSTIVELRFTRPKFWG